MLEKQAKEAKRRRLEATSTATSTGTFTAPARKSSFLLNFIRKTLMRAWVLKTDVRHACMGIRNRRMYINIQVKKKSI